MSAETRVAVKLAYDGSEFYGYQRQPGRRTVEGDLVEALLAVEAVDSAESAGLRSSSRTDRGVSALGNVVSFRTDFSLNGLCSALNSEMDGIWARSAAAVPEDFNPRWARQRWYRYHLPRDDHDLAYLSSLLGRFVGRHDFSRFSRKDDRDPVRTIDSIDVSESTGLLLVDLRAESFLWNMVRRIVWMVDACGKGEIDQRYVGPAAAEAPRRVGLVPPEPLVLMDVDCGIEFVQDEKAAGRLREEFSERLLRCAVEGEFARQILKSIGR